MTNLKVSRQAAPTGITKTVNAEVEITPRELADLRFFLSGLLISNRNFVGTIDQWYAKNDKKLKALFEKCQGDDKAIDLKFGILHEKGHLRLWDEVEGGFECWLKIRKDGTHCFLDDNLKEMPDMEKNMFVKLKDATQKEDYEAAREEYADRKYKCNVVKINPSLIENLNIPTMGASKQDEQPKKLNRIVFYDNLVMPDEQEEQVEGSEENTNGKGE